MAGKYMILFNSTKLEAGPDGLLVRPIWQLRVIFEEAAPHRKAVSPCGWLVGGTVTQHRNGFGLAHCSPVFQPWSGLKV